jgi:hypothetical protein
MASNKILRHHLKTSNSIVMKASNLDLTKKKKSPNKQKHYTGPKKTHHLLNPTPSPGFHLKPPPNAHVTHRPLAVPLGSTSIYGAFPSNATSQASYWSLVLLKPIKIETHKHELSPT